jgi:hypothetical protein
MQAAFFPLYECVMKAFPIVCLLVNAILGIPSLIDIWGMGHGKSLGDRNWHQSISVFPAS